MTWTPAKIAHLRDLWTVGKTANVISNMLGVTRNAVIGKAHRLGLQGRASPIKPTGSGERPRMMRKPPRRLDVKLTSESDARAALPKLPPVPRLAARVLAIGTCCWTDCNHAPWSFCGEPAHNGSWCAKHRARVYQTGPLARL